jgi:hypothetical protein
MFPNVFIGIFPHLHELCLGINQFAGLFADDPGTAWQQQCHCGNDQDKCAHDGLLPAGERHPVISAAEKVATFVVTNYSTPGLCRITGTRR